MLRMSGMCSIKFSYADSHVDQSQLISSNSLCEGFTTERLHRQVYIITL